MAISSRPNQDADHAEGPGRRCPRKIVPVVLVLVGFHLLAVLAEPLHFFSRSEVQTSPEFAALRRTLAPYVEWLYLDHGYFFFAPNPGPSHLVAAKLAANSGTSTTQTGTAEASENELSIGEIAYLFPDRTRQWPRLLYHRYFMLSEFYNNVFAPSELLEEDRQDPEFVARWTRDRQFYSSLQNSIANSISHRLSESNPELGQPQRPSIDLIRLERPLPSVEQILKQGIRLNDSRALEVLPEAPGLSHQAPGLSNGPTMSAPASVPSVASGVSTENKILRVPSGEAIQPQRLTLPPRPSGKL